MATKKVESKPPANASPEVKSSWEKFKDFLRTHKVVSRGLKTLSGISALNKYKDHLEKASAVAGAVGYGKKGKRMVGGALINHIHMRGGSWGDFTSWVKRTAGKVKDGVVKVAKYAYDKAKPVIQYVKDKPLTAASTALHAISKIPGVPYSEYISKGATAVGTAGAAIGKGKRHRAHAQSGGGKIDMYF